MKEDFLINQEFTFSEYIKATFYLTIRMKYLKRLFLFGFIVGILGGILDFILLPQNATNLFLAIAKIFYLPLFFFLFFGIGATLVSALIFKLKPALFNGTEYRFNHWGMEKTGNKIDFSAPWRDFKKYTESSNFLFLFLNNNSAHIVQKRMFDSSVELENFKEFINEKLSAK